MEAWQLGALVLAATAGGAINSVAGGGTFLTFPLLFQFGIPGRQANATSTVALWPGAVSSAVGYRDVLRRERHLVALLVVSAVGGLLGAELLLHTSEPTFTRLVPWLMLAATVIFACGRPVSRWLRELHHKPAGPGTGAAVALVLAQFAVAVYGGYFGAGIGILMLAALAAFGLEDLHAMNGLKNILGATINAVAILAFWAGGAVRWDLALPMAAGSIVGGYAGSRLSRRVPVPLLRGVVIGVGAALSAFYFWRAYA